jgi:hypothetical protein
MRWQSFLIVAAIVFVAATAGNAPAATRVIVFAAHRMTAASIDRGDCWTTSIASRRRDAYRCMVRNIIYDPCFVLNSRSVACPSALKPDLGIRIALTKQLPPPQRGGARNVWMMQLANGVTCNIGTGTVVLNYPFYCTGNWVCAPPQTRPGPQFTECGQPLSSVKVTARRRFVVSLAYE